MLRVSRLVVLLLLLLCAPARCVALEASRDAGRWRGRRAGAALQAPLAALPRNTTANGTSTTPVVDSGMAQAMDVLDADGDGRPADPEESDGTGSASGSSGTHGTLGAPMSALGNASGFRTPTPSLEANGTAAAIVDAEVAALHELRGRLDVALTVLGVVSYAATVVNTQPMALMELARLELVRGEMTCVGSDDANDEDGTPRALLVGGSFRDDSEARLPFELHIFRNGVGGVHRYRVGCLVAAALFVAGIGALCEVAKRLQLHPAPYPRIGMAVLAVYPGCVFSAAQLALDDAAGTGLRVLGSVLFAGIGVGYPGVLWWRALRYGRFQAVALAVAVGDGPAVHGAGNRIAQGGGSGSGSGSGGGAGDYGDGDTAGEPAWTRMFLSRSLWVSHTSARTFFPAYRWVFEIYRPGYHQLMLWEIAGTGVLAFLVALPSAATPRTPCHLRNGLICTVFAAIFAAVVAYRPYAAPYHNFIGGLFTFATLMVTLVLWFGGSAWHAMAVWLGCVAWVMIKIVVDIAVLVRWGRGTRRDGQIATSSFEPPPPVCFFVPAACCGAAGISDTESASLSLGPGSLPSSPRYALHPQHLAGFPPAGGCDVDDSGLCSVRSPRSPNSPGSPGSASLWMNPLYASRTMGEAGVLPQGGGGGVASTRSPPTNVKWAEGNMSLSAASGGGGANTHAPAHRYGLPYLLRSLGPQCRSASPVGPPPAVGSGGAGSAGSGEQAAIRSPLLDSERGAPARSAASSSNNNNNYTNANGDGLRRSPTSPAAVVHSASGGGGGGGLRRFIASSSVRGVSQPNVGAEGVAGGAAHAGNANATPPLATPPSGGLRPTRLPGTPQPLLAALPLEAPSTASKRGNRARSVSATCAQGGTRCRNSSMVAARGAGATQHPPDPVVLFPSPSSRDVGAVGARTPNIDDHRPRGKSLRERRGLSAPPLESLLERSWAAASRDSAGGGVLLVTRETSVGNHSFSTNPLAGGGAAGGAAADTSFPDDSPEPSPLATTHTTTGTAGVGGGGYASTGTNSGFALQQLRGTPRGTSGEQAPWGREFSGGGTLLSARRGRPAPALAGPGSAEASPSDHELYNTSSHSHHPPGVGVVHTPLAPGPPVTPAAFSASSVPPHGDGGLATRRGVPGGALLGGGGSTGVAPASNDWLLPSSASHAKRGGLLAAATPLHAAGGAVGTPAHAAYMPPALESVAAGVATPSRSTGAAAATLTSWKGGARRPSRGQLGGTGGAGASSGKTSKIADDLGSGAAGGGGGGGANGGPQPRGASVHKSSTGTGTPAADDRDRNADPWATSQRTVLDIAAPLHDVPAATPSSMRGVVAAAPGGGGGGGNGCPRAHTLRAPRHSAGQLSARRSQDITPAATPKVQLRQLL